MTTFCISGPSCYEISQAEESRQWFRESLLTGGHEDQGHVKAWRHASASTTTLSVSQRAQHNTQPLIKTRDQSTSWLTAHITRWLLSQPIQELIDSSVTHLSGSRWFFAFDDTYSWIWFPLHCFVNALTMLLKDSRLNIFFCIFKYT